MSNKFSIIGGVEIGTSKVTALIGEITGRGVSIVGFGTCQSSGIVKGAVIDFRLASNAVHTAIEIAEKNAGMRVDGVYLAQTGKHLQGFENEARIEVSSADNRVRQNDIAAVCDQAMRKNVPDHRTIVHNIRRPFRLDGEIVSEPENLLGRHLEVGYWTVHGDKNTVTNNLHIISGYNVKVDDLILSSLAAGTMVTTAEERQNGVLVIDIGAGTSDYVLYRYGCGYMTGVVAVGGDHITNDLVIGLQIGNSGKAEKLKTRFGRGTVITRDKNDKVWLNGDSAIGDVLIPKLSIEQITAARVGEIFEVIRKELGANFTPEGVPVGVVITGGSSKLLGIAEAAAKAFEVPARVGEVSLAINEQVRDPSFATGLGLLFTAAHVMGSASRQPRKQSLLDKFLGRR